MSAHEMFTGHLRVSLLWSKNMAFVFIFLLTPSIQHYENAISIDVICDWAIPNRLKIWRRSIILQHSEIELKVSISDKSKVCVWIRASVVVSYYFLYSFISRIIFRRTKQALILGFLLFHEMNQQFLISSANFYVVCTSAFF